MIWSMFHIPAGPTLVPDEVHITGIATTSWRTTVTRFIPVMSGVKSYDLRTNKDESSPFDTKNSTFEVSLRSGHYEYMHLRGLARTKTMSM